MRDIEAQRQLVKQLSEAAKKLEEEVTEKEALEAAYVPDSFDDFASFFQSDFKAIGGLVGLKPIYEKLPNLKLVVSKECREITAQRLRDERDRLEKEHKDLQEKEEPLNRIELLDEVVPPPPPVNPDVGGALRSYACPLQKEEKTATDTIYFGWFEDYLTGAQGHVPHYPHHYTEAFGKEFLISRERLIAEDSPLSSSIKKRLSTAREGTIIPLHSISNSSRLVLKRVPELYLTLQANLESVQEEEAAFKAKHACVLKKLNAFQTNKKKLKKKMEKALRPPAVNPQVGIHSYVCPLPKDEKK